MIVLFLSRLQPEIPGAPVAYTGPRAAQTIARLWVIISGGRADLTIKLRDGQRLTFRNLHQGRTDILLSFPTKLGDIVHLTFQPVGNATLIAVSLKAYECELDPVAQWMELYHEAQEVMGSHSVASGTD
jgi:hypothetical protein